MQQSKAAFPSRDLDGAMRFTMSCHHATIMATLVDRSNSFCVSYTRIIWRREGWPCHVLLSFYSLPLEAGWCNVLRSVFAFGWLHSESGYRTALEPGGPSNGVGIAGWQIKL